MVKNLGVYHFAGKNGASQEAEYFVNNIKGYIGKALLALDWEGSGVSRGPAWAKEWLDRVRQLTGVKPVIYMNNGTVNGYDWSSVANGDYGLWNAGYYAGSTAMGYNSGCPDHWRDRRLEICGTVSVYSQRPALRLQR